MEPGILRPTRDSLSREAEYFFKCIYGKDAPPEINDKYRDLHLMKPELVSGSQSAIDCILRRRLDVQAIELAARRSPANALSRKLQSLSFLSETMGGQYEYYYNERNRAPLAHFVLIYFLAHSFWKFLKGKILIRWYNLNLTS